MVNPVRDLNLFGGSDGDALGIERPLGLEERGNDPVDGPLDRSDGRTVRPRPIREVASVRPALRSPWPVSRKKRPSSRALIRPR